MTTFKQILEVCCHDLEQDCVTALQRHQACRDTINHRQRLHDRCLCVAIRGPRQTAASYHTRRLDNTMARDQLQAFFEAEKGRTARENGVSHRSTTVTCGQQRSLQMAAVLGECLRPAHPLEISRGFDSPAPLFMPSTRDFGSNGRRDHSPSIKPASGQPWDARRSEQVGEFFSETYSGSRSSNQFGWNSDGSRRAPGVSSLSVERASQPVDEPAGAS